ncbi:sulfatase-like hydrolase/transferase [Reichenbachiella ulvae]|uniref:Sulfatase-like hydrolase/transferase n=1 Tax=Reichenbachiella ulvae TaxID=2980104 RepID=A0ABT3D057_9BACT|nr:sulfatase-like hydrolase/transferase [Reichenbachiella ulvae]MCV9389267.1 sulfatase-like hydrolase/transferase [Reichenbachiella ulvae]
MKRILLLMVCILCSTLSHAQKKNVLFIAIDDLNDWTGAFGGNPQSITPNLDALANKGVAFQNAYCASPVCNPSRTAILTGRRPHATGLVNNDGGRNFREDDQQWVRELITMPEYFSSQGYESVAQGKIFHKHDSNPEVWDVLGPGGQGAAGGVNDEVAGISWGYSPNEKLEETGDWKSADYGAQYLAKNHDKPFFLAIGLFRPHLPFRAPKEFFDLFDPDTLNIPAGYKANDLQDAYSRGSNNKLSEVQAAGKWKEVIRAYLACIAFADANLGHLIDALDDSQYADNTIVVLWGDHGWHLGEKEHFQKFTLWERAIKTPLIIYDPSKGSGNSFYPVSLQDLYPTLVSLAGIEQPDFEVRGRDLTPLLEDPDREDWCGAALTSYSTGHSIRSNQFRYTLYNNGEEELYDHKNDPWEWENLANHSDLADQKQQMAEALNQMKEFEESPFEQCESVVVRDSQTSEGIKLGINMEYQENDILIYPNPSDGILHILKQNQYWEASYQVFGANGVELIQGTGGLLDMNSNAAGRYWLRLEGYESAIPILLN